MSLQSVTLENGATKITTPMTDPYRSFLYGDSEKETAWRHGGPPSYEDVNSLFEKGRTQVCITGREVEGSLRVPALNASSYSLH